MKPRTGKLEDEYAYATECQLATLSWLTMLSKSALSEITRQRNISFHMLKVCQEHESEITWEQGIRKDFSRVQDLLDDAKNDNLFEALNRWTLKGFDKVGQAARWLKSFEKSEKDKVPR